MLTKRNLSVGSEIHEDKFSDYFIEKMRWARWIKLWIVGEWTTVLVLANSKVSRVIFWAGIVRMDLTYKGHAVPN